MSRNAKKYYGSSLALLGLGLLALYGGTPWLLVVIPAAVLVCYRAPAPKLGSSRN